MAFGVPTASECRYEGAGAFGVFFSESLSVPCVDLFALLSGWFGITLSVRKLASLFFQCLFFAALVLCAVLAYDPGRWLHAGSFATLLMLNGNDYWFVKAYAGLCIFAPFLNAFIERGGERGMRRMLIVFYAFQTVYAWLSIDGARWLCGGYSAVSLAGLYLLARYVRLYGHRLTSRSRSFYLALFAAITLFQAIVAWVVTYLGLPVAGRLFTYTNPLVIMQALALLLFFSKLSFHSRVVNWIAASSVAAYLLHANELVLRSYYAPAIKSLFDCFHPLAAFALAAALIAAVFLAAVVIDKLRMALWRLVSKPFAP